MEIFRKIPWVVLGEKGVTDLLTGLFLASIGDAKFTFEPMTLKFLFSATANWLSRTNQESSKTVVIDMRWEIKSHEIVVGW